MSEKHYEMFVPPVSVADRSPLVWTKKEAQIYFSWLLEVLDRRVSGLLDFLGLTRSELDDDRELLMEAGKRVVEVVNNSQFSELNSDGNRVLTNAGYAIAADMGLLMAQVLVKHAGNLVRWEIVRKPKSDVSYNMPVISGVGVLPLDPIRVSIARLLSFYRGVNGYDAWLNVFDACLSKAAANRR